jgi:hypothetical protein
VKNQKIAGGECVKEVIMLFSLLNGVDFFGNSIKKGKNQRCAYIAGDHYLVPYK